MAVTLAPEPPNPALPSLTTLLTRWEQSLEVELVDEAASRTLVNVYRLVTTPSRPVDVESRVTILAAYPASERVPAAPPGLYDLYDAHICGRILRTSPPRGGWVAAVLENECRRSATKYAAVMMPDMQGCVRSAETVWSPWSLGAGEGNEGRLWFKPADERSRCGGAQCAMGGVWNEGTGVDDGDATEEELSGNEEDGVDSDSGAELTIEISDEIVDEGDQ
ncbi:hypothetical protein C8Q76DRAFT_799650 [Earliella scabrosa]|nr:hypothetical protein C8Q76DRAFT_799650 [Earliella scabrosa]